ncbi:gtpase-activating rap/ran-gap domain-like protein [Anaeramoeba flamelloides]|uniref:Gtpase-activating rap/ran-gap domain-like protein n=2 Tax=Anaeramoeba flamelloides TaxID=1746091 RepID=A0ABQ8X1A6_9EUKA|nr:gtpase-activating rap/ran-gap domain-like protein [Anaeramoeba flamelloides]
MNSFYLFTIFEDEDNKELLIMCSTESESKFKRIKKLDITYSIWRKLFSLGPKPQSLIKAFDLEFDGSMIKKCLQENEEKELLQMENLEIPRNYKFGVLYIKDQQKTQEEYITNVETSKEFQDFLDILGEPITLLGWKKYRGGLDVKHNASGETSIYTEWNDFSIMFHVLTILPYNEKDSQQVTRKKHIGNDVVVIVFIDGNTTFVPSSFKSKQNHIFIAVKPLKDDEIIKYQLEVSMRNCVPQYEPFLPLPPIIKKDELRDFLLTKACQGERIAQKSGKFFDRFVNFRRSLLEEIWERYQY